jgi:hypothetical protein
VYVDTNPRVVFVPFDEMQAIEAAASTPLDLARADTLLLVADLVNADPGSAGECWIGPVTAERSAGR